MDVSNAASAHQSLFLAAMQSEKKQEQAVLEVVTNATQQAAEIAKSAPGAGVGQTVDVST
jgi:DNA-binding protein